MQPEITKKVQVYYLVTGFDTRTLEVYEHEKRKLNKIIKEGYFKWFMPGYQGPKERKPTPGRWHTSLVAKIEKITKTTFTEVEEIEIPR